YFLRTLLRYDNHDLLEAADGAEALEQIRTARPELVITDLLMPRVDGYELLRQLRVDPALAGVPVIFYTAVFHERQVRELVGSFAGCYYLAKPADPQAILQTVRAALGLHPVQNNAAVPEDFDREHMRLLTDTLSQKVEELREVLQMQDLANILALDLECRVTRWNAGCQRLYGFTSDQAVGQIGHELLKTKFPSPLSQIRKTLWEKGRWEGELIHQSSDGRRVTVASEWILHRDSKGEPSAIIEVNTDISARKVAEDALRESEARYRHLSESLEETVKKQVAELRHAKTLAALGQMVSVVAHEIRNPLHTINLGIESLQKALQEGKKKEVREISGEIAHGLKLMNSVITELLNYSKPVTLEPSWGMLRSIVEQALGVLGDALENISVDLDLEQMDVFIDEGKMTRVFVNLFSNAVDSMPDGGHLKVHSEYSVTDGALCLKLLVSDTGCGMTEDVLEHVQEPFFTTKIRGVGLGIPVCKKIVEAHDGALAIRSKVNEGTTVELTFPPTIFRSPVHEHAV
ncbi:MAG: response regulator, partial [Candidatus Lindowbacteria bacterium]|nr:response regulator [Candidatus Lindowbacteria bacterium]